MPTPDDIGASLDRILVEHDAENLRADARTLAARLHLALDASVAHALIALAGRITAVEARALHQEHRDALASEDDAAVAFRVGRDEAHMLAEILIPGVEARTRRLAGIFRDPEAFLAEEKEQLA